MLLLPVPFGSAHGDTGFARRSCSPLYGARAAITSSSEASSGSLVCYNMRKEPLHLTSCSLLDDPLLRLASSEGVLDDLRALPHADVAFGVGSGICEIQLDALLPLHVAR